MLGNLTEKKLSGATVDDGVNSSLEEQGRIDATDMHRMGKEQQFKVRDVNGYCSATC
jgi:hypothetical protein